MSEKQNPGTCTYVAKKDDPSNWHGDDSTDWVLDNDVWECPHDKLNDSKYCAFHSDPADVPECVSESELFIESINEKSNTDDEKVARRKKEFVGATFDSLNIDGEVIDANDKYPIRLDHAKFENGVIATGTTFHHALCASGALVESKNMGPRQNQRNINFSGALFDGNGDISFKNSIFEGDGIISFTDANFENQGEVIFSNVDFDGVQEVSFTGTKFSNGDTIFSNTKFDSTYVWFEESEFVDDVLFDNAEFVGNEMVTFAGASRTDCIKFSGGVNFHNTEFHSGIVRFDYAEFNNVANFEYSKFLCDELSMNRSKINAHISFFGAELDTSVNFEDAIFSGQNSVLFEGTKFTGDGDISFDRTEFIDCETIRFDCAEFNDNGEVTFENSVFNTTHLLHFGGTEFCQNNRVSFKGSNFDSDRDISFEGMEFNDNSCLCFEDTKYSAENISFNRTNFGGSVSFRKAEFSGPVSFVDVWFHAEAVVNFSMANFRNTVNYEGSEQNSVRLLQGKFDFSNATFHQLVEFKGEGTKNINKKQYRLVFSDSVNFSGASFLQGVDFSSTRFPPDTIFNDANLQKSDFSEADLSGLENFSTASFDGANLSSTNFSNANLMGVSMERVQLNRSELLGTNLIGTKLFGALLGDARINRKTTFWLDQEEKSEITNNSPLPVRLLRQFKRTLRKLSGRRGTDPFCVYDPRYRGKDGEDDLEKAAEVYGTLETLAQENSLPVLASECFLGRKDIQLKQYWQDGNWMMVSRSLVPNMVARYGDSPLRVLLTGLTTVTISGVLYYHFELIENTQSDAPLTMIDSIYFSALTFTTLGYGDFNPTNTAGQALAVAETSVGVILLAILVFVFGRRATR